MERMSLLAADAGATWFWPVLRIDTISAPDVPNPKNPVAILKDGGYQRAPQGPSLWGKVGKLSGGFSAKTFGLT